MKYRTVSSMREFQDILEKQPNKSNLMIWFDLDETLVESHGDTYTSVLIEPEPTQKLFDYIHKSRIPYTFITARFHDTVCDSSKRNLKDIQENVYYTIYPLLKQLGINFNEYAQDNSAYIIRDNQKKCVGIAYKGIIFTGLKGPAIKHFSDKYGLSDRDHIFLDDNMIYLNSVNRNVKNCLVVQRIVSED